VKRYPLEAVAIDAHGRLVPLHRRGAGGEFRDSDA
jgi:hypothetical protein